MAWREVYVGARRLSCCAAACLLLYIEISGSLATNASLVGVAGDSSVSAVYTSPLIALFLKQPPVQVLPTFAYLNSTDGGRTIRVFEDNCHCDIPSTMYSHAYLTRLLSHLLGEHRSWHAPFDAATTSVVVDCHYDGIRWNDTTALKVYLVDKLSYVVSTIILQTLNVRRSAKHIDTVCGFATIHVGDSYHHLLRLEFPFNVGPFDEVKVNAPALAAWDVTVLRTGEALLAYGTSGVFRETPKTQGNYFYYNWSTPVDGDAFLTYTEYLEVPFSVDCYAWGRCLLGLGVSVLLILHMLVSSVIAFNLYKQDGTLWIPDLYPAIQWRIQLRAVLLLLATVANHGWHVLEYCLKHGNARLRLDDGFVLDAMVRSDGATYLLAIAVGLADLLHLRVGLDVLLSIYMVCLIHREALVHVCAACVSASDAFLSRNYVASIVSEPGAAMSLWTYHANDETPVALLLTELMWFLVALLLVVVYMLCVKAWSTRQRRRVQAEVFADVAPRRRPALKDTSLLRHQSWRQRTLTENFEQSDVQLLSLTYGIIAPFPDDPTHDGFLSPSGVWLLGHLILCDRYLVCVRDYPWLWLNVLCRRNVGRVYCFRIHRNGHTSANLELLPFHAVVARDLVTRLSLRHLH
ncbi:hypothetical protein SPRG_06543 [Saprolegnia parasitica CBS 223.65]|uniref:Uncharacterized protein n=1 Tax=Saprolegnia parasitica (strain CBS 223.65) TaxID=695850 RepID=A0A067CD89_SAPPC|nr:hypothetical protein SPRG_06543 [Saprolegnia parasitica CBS 223.65]KDO28689.1 hypothetical protein SPRG_06543 [Saprolegnia parasitica CBS 223.65]|eukprot:XP_012200747.1 hypothetical protein SPRG_06543 [Saprolegnia parasitica CBS 223.65]